MNMKKISFAAIIGLTFFASVLQAQDDFDTKLPYTGKIRPHHAREIQSSNRSIGAETMDRDYTIYKNWKSYLGAGYPNIVTWPAETFLCLFSATKIKLLVRRR